MPYQNNNNRITPQTSGKRNINPVTQPVNKEVRYQPDLRGAQNSLYLAQSLSSLGKGIIDFDQSGIMQRKAEEEAIELIYKDDAEGKNRHEWEEAQKNVKGLQKFNPYIKDTYKDLAAQDYYQKALYELTEDINFFAKPDNEIKEFIQTKKNDLINILRESNIDPRISAKYLEDFHLKCNDFYGQYLSRNAQYTYDLSLDKLSNEISRGARTAFYDIPKEQQGSYLSTMLTNIVKEHRDIPSDDLVKKVLMPSALRIIRSHTGALEQSEFINAFKNTMIGDRKLIDIVPDMELELRDTFRTVQIQAMQEEETLFKQQEKFFERQEQAAENEFFETFINNPDVNLADLAQELIIKYDIPLNRYGDFITTAAGLKTKLNSLNTTESDSATLRYFNTRLGLREFDRKSLTKAYADGLLTEADFHKLLSMDNSLEKEAAKETQQILNAGYKAVFDRANQFSKNKDIKAILNKIRTGDNSNALLDFEEALGSVNIDVSTGTIDKKEGQKRIEALMDYVQRVYIDKEFNTPANPKNLASLAYRKSLPRIPESSYNVKSATNSFKELRLLKNNTITSGIKDNRTVTLKDGRRVTSNHQAYDLRAAVGTSVYMPRSGGSIFAKGSEANSGGMGNWAIVRLNTGHFMLLMHLQTVPQVPVGREIKGGQAFALTGNSGNSQAPHLDVSFYSADARKRLRVEDVVRRIRINN